MLVYTPTYLPKNAQGDLDVARDVALSVQLVLRIDHCASFVNRMEDVKTVPPISWNKGRTRPLLGREETRVPFKDVPWSIPFAQTEEKQHTHQFLFQASSLHGTCRQSIHLGDRVLGVPLFSWE